MDTILIHIVGFLQLVSEPLYAFAYIVAVFLMLSGTDDFAVDLYYWFFYLFAANKLNRFQSEHPENLHRVEEKPIAMFIPAWQEQDVIHKMLKHTCETLQYERYDIFVGVYPNDPQTLERVQVVTQTYLRVHVVISRHPGPSTKAENLNEILEGMLKYENQTGVRYDIIVMHDAEDVVHPMSLKIHNYFIPKFDMVQLPVFPLRTPSEEFVQWTYADEFAENHTKDLVARQIFNGFIPSAGVGTGYNRWLIEFIGTSYAKNIFRKASLTEDYDIALRLAMGKANLLFLYTPFGVPVATRAYFPNKFWTAVRQKSRWLTGICLQSWQNIGWVGDMKFRFTLYRDRKAVITNAVNALAYIVLTYVFLYELARWSLGSYGTLASLIHPGTTLWTIVLIDTGLMIWRFIHRFITVSRIYGPLAGALSIVRLPLSNIINFLATVRGVKLFFQSKGKRRRIEWDKTEHTFPEPLEATGNQ